MSEEKKSKYVKLSHIEHVLKRPDTYIGSLTTDEIEQFTLESDDLSNIKIVKKKVKNNEGFIKIFDEIITNASDHSIRTGEVTYIRVNIENDKISVENDGSTIPIEIHPTEKIYNAELVFFNLMSGENYDDTQERNLAGKNGYGSKLCSIFSKKVKIECSDGKQLYRQWCKDNMSKIEKPEIIEKNDGKSYTRFTYYPDYSHFDIDRLTSDIKLLMYKRCLDIASYIPSVRVSINGKTLPIKKMSDYMKMHLDDSSEFFYEELENGWEVGIAKSPTHTFEQTSIVNGCTTYRGGTHVNYISLQLSKDIADKMPKKINMSWQDVKNKLFLFLSCKVPNPNFDTQTKTNLTNKMTVDITQNCSVSEKTIKKILKSDIVKSILAEIELREKLSLSKMGGSKKKVIKMDKLVDANKAGTKDSDKCHIFLCEGDCIDSETEVLVIREGDKCVVKSKDLKIGDGVITHNSNIKMITNVTSQINKGITLKTRLGDMFFGKEHRLFVYDTVEDIFLFKKVKDINKSVDKLVKNKNIDFSNLFSIESIEPIEHDIYDKKICIMDDEILSSNSHKFCCYNIDGQYFKMISCELMTKEIDKWLLVNY